MEKQAKQNLLSFIEEIKSNIDLEKEITCKLIKKDYISIFDTVSNLKNYIESRKCLIFNKIIDFTNQRQINIKEFNEINNCLNREFDITEEFIDDNLPNLYDRELSVFRYSYVKLYESISMISFTIKHL